MVRGDEDAANAVLEAARAWRDSKVGQEYLSRTEWPLWEALDTWEATLG